MQSALSGENITIDNIWPQLWEFMCEGFRPHVNVTSNVITYHCSACRRRGTIERRNEFAVSLFALCTNFSERGSHCIVTSLLANTYFVIKLDRVSCTNYFMSIHNLRYSVQRIQIATRNKTNLWKIPRFWRFNQLCTRHSYVCRHGLYVV